MVLKLLYTHLGRHLKLETFWSYPPICGNIKTGIFLVLPSDIWGHRTMSGWPQEHAFWICNPGEFLLTNAWKPPLLASCLIPVFCHQLRWQATWGNPLNSSEHLPLSSQHTHSTPIRKVSCCHQATLPLSSYCKLLPYSTYHAWLILQDPSQAWTLWALSDLVLNWGTQMHLYSDLLKL